jgi:hypothetical protein
MRVVLLTVFALAGSFFSVFGRPPRVAEAAPECGNRPVSTCTSTPAPTSTRPPASSTPAPTPSSSPAPVNSPTPAPPVPIGSTATLSLPDATVQIPTTGPVGTVVPGVGDTPTAVATEPPTATIAPTETSTPTAVPTWTATLAPTFMPTEAPTGTPTAELVVSEDVLAATPETEMAEQPPDTPLVEETFLSGQPARTLSPTRIVRPTATRATPTPSAQTPERVAPSNQGALALEVTVVRGADSQVAGLVIGPLTPRPQPLEGSQSSPDRSPRYPQTDSAEQIGIGQIPLLGGVAGAALALGFLGWWVWKRAST